MTCLFLLLDFIVKVKLNCHITLMLKLGADFEKNKLMCILSEVKIVFSMIKFIMFSFSNPSRQTFEEGDYEEDGQRSFEGKVKSIIEY